MEKKEMMQLSRSAYNEYQARLEYMKNTRRLEVAQHIKEARAFGDISESAEYDGGNNDACNVLHNLFFCCSYTVIQVNYVQSMRPCLLARIVRAAFGLPVKIGYHAA